jgi:hypothetical protein
MTNNTDLTDLPIAIVLPWTPPTPAPAGYVPTGEVYRHLTEDEGYTPTEAVDMINSIYADWGAEILLTFDQWEIEIMRKLNE